MAKRSKAKLRAQSAASPQNVFAQLFLAKFLLTTFWSLYTNGLEIRIFIAKTFFYSIFEIKHCQLKAIPSFFGKFVHLERLNLEDNQIEKIPSSLGKLENLLEIDLSRNELVSFPSEGFPMLEWLE